MKTVGVILGSGIGNRFGASFPKQFMSLNGKLVIQYSIDAMANSCEFDHIICTIPPNEIIPNTIFNLKNVDQYIIGGKTRTQTLLNVLKECPQDTDYIVFHDSVRPFIKAEHFSIGLNKLKTEELAYVLTVQDITDALIHNLFGNIHSATRNDYKLCQTPEFFKFKSLKEREQDLILNHTNYTYIGQTFDTYAEHYKGDIISYKENNLKITYEKDLFNAEQLMKYAEIDESNYLNLKGKRILLFGGSGDIGKAIKKYLKLNGAIVYAPSRKEIDISKDWFLVLPEFIKKFDCIIHSAGTYDTDETALTYSYTPIMDVNFKSVVNIVSMAEQHWLKEGGNIIILGSTAGAFGRKGISLYSASKSAVHTFVEAYHHKLLEKNIKINVIAPAKVQGKLQKSLNPNADQSQMISADRLAEIIAHYVTTDKTGQIVYIRYGLENKK